MLLLLCVRWLKVKALSELLWSNRQGMKRRILGSQPRGTILLFPKIDQYDLTKVFYPVNGGFISLLIFQ